MTTLEALERLETAGFDREQAAAIVASFDDASTDRLATKGDLAELRTDTKTDTAALRADNTLLKWMVGFNLSLTAAILWKLL